MVVNELNLKTIMTIIPQMNEPHCENTRFLPDFGVGWGVGGGGGEFSHIKVVWVCAVGKQPFFEFHSLQKTPLFPSNEL